MLAKQILNQYPLKKRMVTRPQLEALMRELESVIDVEGDVVELGCFRGETSVYFQRVLDRLNSTKRLHVYDSFHGLPDKNYHDEDASAEYHKNALKTESDKVVANFQAAGLKLPVIHEGWFSEASYPEKIAFAFFDGDFYDSIIDSFEMVLPRLSLGGVICIHDFGYPKLPGAKKACLDYLPNGKFIEIATHLAKYKNE